MQGVRSELVARIDETNLRVYALREEMMSKISDANAKIDDT